jgi:hypothetical protein
MHHREKLTGMFHIVLRQVIVYSLNSRISMSTFRACFPYARQSMTKMNDAYLFPFILKLEPLDPNSMKKK